MVPPSIHCYIMYKYKNNLLPNTFDEFYQINSVFHRYPTRKANQFRGPKLKTKMAQLFIRNSGVTIWNNYENQIDINKSISCFKKDITSIFLSQYSDQEIHNNTNSWSINEVYPPYSAHFSLLSHFCLPLHSFYSLQDSSTYWTILIDHK